jgi:adenylate kinase
MNKCLNKKFTKQIIILMLGAPGVGKGTYSRMLSKDMGIPEFSTGELLRKLSKENNPLASQIQNIINKGELIDDRTMIELVKSELEKPNYRNGVILDGFPRNENQSLLFESFKHVDLVLNIKLNEEVLVKKLLGRRVCKGCGKNYNVCEIKENGYDMEPLLPKNDPSKCDECHSELFIRDDDREDIIRDRINLYKKKTQLLEDYYDKMGILYSLELKRGIKDYPILKDVVVRHLGNKILNTNI